MDQTCLMVPIIPGKTDDARDLMQELEGPRKPDYGRSLRRLGITKEVWYLAHTPGGDQLAAYIESAGFGRPCPCCPGHKRNSRCGSNAASPETCHTAE